MTLFSYCYSQKKVVIFIDAIYIYYLWTILSFSVH